MRPLATLLVALFALGGQPAPAAAREDAPAAGNGAAPLGTPDRVRRLLEAAGLRRVEFGSPERLGVAYARLAWTSGEILGFVTLEARSQRSTVELARDQEQLYSAGCTADPELRSTPPLGLSGYTLHQVAVRCPVHDGLRIAAITSVLDAADVLSIVHMGLDSEADGLDRLNRALGERLRQELRR